MRLIIPENDCWSLFNGASKLLFTVIGDAGPGISPAPKGLHNQ